MAHGRPGPGQAKAGLFPALPGRMARAVLDLAANPASAPEILRPASHLALRQRFLQASGKLVGTLVLVMAAWP